MNPNIVRTASSPSRPPLFPNLIPGGAERCVVDLDQTLVFSKAFHLFALSLAAEKSLKEQFPSTALPSRDQLKETYEPLRGQSYDKILIGLANSLGLELEHLQSNFQLVLTNLVDNNSLIPDNVFPKPIPGAAELLNHLGEAALICTGSTRPMASALLKLTGLMQYVDPNRMICCADKFLSGNNKADQDYWKIVLHDTKAQKCIGFEDHPHGTQWLLEVANVSHVFVLPSVEISKFAELIAKYPSRLNIVPSWAKLLQGISRT